MRYISNLDLIRAAYLLVIFQIIIAFLLVMWNCSYAECECPRICK